MKILIIGATRGIGKALLETALEDKFDITVLARIPEKITVSHPQLRVVKGDVLETESLEAVANGQDAICSCIGVPITFKPVDLFSKAARNILVTVKQNPGQKYIAVTGIGAGESKEHGGFLYAGSAYVFGRAGGVWSEEQKLTASDASGGDRFGNALSIEFDSAVIGAFSYNARGVAYAFVRSGGTWLEQQQLSASDAVSNDVFGISVAFSGDTLVIGADLNDEKALNAGAVYVFTRSGGSWSQQAKLTAADGAETDIFGVRVAISGDTVLISARRDDDDVMGIDAGSAYIFTRTGTTWQQQIKLTASDGAADDRFGRSVALVADTAVIGAMFQDDKGDNSGSAYVFTRSGTTWSQQVKLTAADGAEGDVFGWSVTLSDDTAVITAIRDDDNGNESGSAYVFETNLD